MRLSVAEIEEELEMELHTLVPYELGLTGFRRHGPGSLRLAVSGAVELRIRLRQAESPMELDAYQIGIKDTANDTEEVFYTFRTLDELAACVRQYFGTHDCILDEY